MRARLRLAATRRGVTPCLGGLAGAAAGLPPPLPYYYEGTLSKPLLHCATFIPRVIYVTDLSLGLLALIYLYDGYGVFAVMCLMCMCMHCISAFGRVHRPAGLMVLPAVPSATRHLWTGPRFAYLAEMWIILSISLFYPRLFISPRPTPALLGN